LHTDGPESVWSTADLGLIPAQTRKVPLRRHEFEKRDAGAIRGLRLPEGRASGRACGVSLQRPGAGRLTREG
jgi:hypothetical protein